jgi:DNA (cytosine-5)-methyltransferase 1
MKLTLCDLCAGTGCFSLAFENTKLVETNFSNDLLKNSKIIYDENFKTKLTLEDLNNIDIQKIPKMDILTGGFPCQAFSIAGERKGFDDVRSNVFWKILEIIKNHQPQAFILENVKNLVSHDNGNTFKIIKENIEKLNYHFTFKILNTCLVSGIPQNRERIYLVGFKNKELLKKFKFPEEKNNILPLKNFLEKNISDEFYYTNDSKIYPVLSKDVIKTIEENVVYQYRRYYVRENKNNLCPTLTANMGTGGHNVPIIKDNKGIRKLTPRECFNLQGFPNTYKLPSKISKAGLYQLAGNAVSYPVVFEIAKNLIKILPQNL